MTNAAEQPDRHVLMDPAGMTAVLDRIERAGETVWASFRADPGRQAAPSASDLRAAHRPGTLIIIAPGRRTGVMPGFWRIDRGRAMPVTVRIRDDEPFWPARASWAHPFRCPSCVRGLLTCPRCRGTGRQRKGADLPSDPALADRALHLWRHVPPGRCATCEGNGVLYCNRCDGDPDYPRPVRGGRPRPGDLGQNRMP